MATVRSAAFGLLLVLAACGSGDDSRAVAPTTTAGGQGSTTAPSGTPTTAAPATAAGTVLSVTVRGGSVEGPSRQRAPLNQQVTIRVSSDVAEEVHVHGYDETFQVAAGRTGEATFVADIPGVFEVEFERSNKLLFTLEVR